MRQALIDLGSNTIKLAIYECDHANFSCLRYESRYGYVIEAVRDRILTQDGIKRIQMILTEYQTIAAEYGCLVENNTLHCFSTASLRYIDNLQTVIDEIYSTNSIIIEPISGEDEARYNFLALKQISKTDCFWGADLGGGSMQVVQSVNGNRTWSKSFPIGALKLYRDFVSGILPTREEAEKIRKYVASQVDCLEKQQDKFPFYLMGGTMRLIIKLIGSSKFSCQDLQRFVEECLAFPVKAQEKICAVTPERLTTLVPGMLSIQTVAKTLGASELQFVEVSVREGYLAAHMV